MTDLPVIPEFPELTFEEEDHIYRLDGREVPSVTTLMKPLSNVVYGTVDPGVLSRAAHKGTAVHSANENYVLFGIEDIDPAYALYFEAFKAWWHECKPTPIGTEIRIYHKILEYAGTADLLCIIDGKVTLVDYKTSAQVSRMMYGVQLEGYDRAFDSHGIHIDQQLILHLRKNGTYKEVPFKKSAKCWSVLSSLMTIHNYINEF